MKRPLAILAAWSLSLAAGVQAAPMKPNILFILADDIGYGDLGCYGATKTKTPRVDSLAAQGLRFLDAHAPAAVCTPTRYAFMTGEYAFRKPGTGILPGTAALIIEPGRVTVPSLLKQAGYTTGVVGKWHLGLGAESPTDYNGEIKPGPLEIGFDHAWIIPATGDRTPCVWVENHRVVNLDPKDPIRLDYSVRRGDPLSFVNGIPRIGRQTGGKAALWKDDEIADVLVAKATAFLETNKDKPFFLYLATHDIHVPRVPNPRFRGKSDCGVRGDAIASFDWTVGQVLDTLDRLQLAGNTLVIVTSDNGGVFDNNGPDKEHGVGDPDATNGHLCNGALRGFKGSAYEGGTRVPFIVRWPGHVPSGRTSDELIAHLDMLASFAALTGQTLPDAAGPDSFNVLPALLGEERDKPCREFLVEQGHPLALRQGPWKFIPGADETGGKRRRGQAPAAQLFNLAKDIGEKDNLAGTHPEKVAELSARLDEFTRNQRTRP
jgi:arylsulfatase A-like enzyme